MIDTVELFRLPNRRKVSLKFLSWYFFKEDIQDVSHCSVEDARMALRLYKKYLELERTGQLKEVLNDIYELGRVHNWKKK